MKNKAENKTKILLAFDSFKGTLTADEACEITAKAAKRNLPDAEVIKLPISDGGEGLCSAMQSALGGKRVKVDVHDAAKRKTKAEYVVLPDGTAVIEMAAASGLPLVSDLPLNASKATSLGTGELILHALSSGCSKIILGLGGSATTDGGAGMASVLGIRYLNNKGNSIICGGELANISRIDVSQINPALLECEITVACDVKNPLYGEKGSAYIFGPQKGAQPMEIVKLDKGLKTLASLLLSKTKINVQSIEGSGAAGGLSVPLIAFANAKLRSGADILLDSCGFDNALEGCTLVITGEGCTDAQSAMGKAVSAVAKRASDKNVPVVVLSGVLGKGHRAMLDKGVTAMFPLITSPQPIQELLASSAENLENAADNLFRLLAALC